MTHATRNMAAGGQHARRFPDLLLFPQHEALLCASAISPEVATARGYRSADRKVMLERPGFSRGLLACAERADWP